MADDLPPFDVTKRIAADLVSQRSRRRRRFMPALALVVVAVASGLLLVGVRPDLLEQPTWQLALQCLSWLLCLVVFPAIGLGLVFPSRATRVGLACGAVGLTLLSSLGVPSANLFESDAHGGLGCGVLAGIYGGVVLGMGLLTGAFVQRRRPAAVYWMAAGVALTGLSAITWHCPITGAAHVVPSHLGVAALAMLAASWVGVAAHRRRLSQDRGEASRPSGPERSCPPPDAPPDA